MESIEQPVAVADEFRVVLLDEIPPTWSDPRSAAVGTAIVHLVAILLLLLVPVDVADQNTERERHQIVTKLFDPPTRITQKAPNKAKVSEEISVAPAVAARPTLPAPQKKFSPPPKATEAKGRKAAPSLPQEPPKITTAQPQQTVQILPPAALTQPPSQAPEPPKLVLESPPAPPQSGQGTGRLKVPGSGIQEAINELSRRGTSSPRVFGDDVDESPSSALSPNTPASARPKIGVELLSDPKGVDMKPYVLQVLQTVRRNWRAVYPESARLGMRGRVVVQFAIAPDGNISKVVYASQSGARALDTAAVSSLSMSNPLPQLPKDFKGDRVILQFTFQYNAPR